MKEIHTPISKDAVQELCAGDMIEISGNIFTGRDAVLPKISQMIENGLWDYDRICLNGGVIFHTAVSPAGVGPTSSNKIEIESSIPILSKAGIRIHLGKGKLKRETIEQLNQHHSVYAVIPPVTALLESKILQRKVVAFAEEGMEAFHMLAVDRFPAIIAVAKGISIY